MSLPQTPSAPPAGEPLSLRLGGLHCASCVRRVETALEAVPGVERALVNLADSSALVYGLATANAPAAVAAVEAAGYSAEVEAPEEPDEIRSEREETERRTEENRLMVRMMVAAAFALPVAVLSMAEIPFTGRALLLFLLTLPVMVWAAGPIFAGAWHQVRRLSADMNVLVALGTGTAFIYSSLVALRDPLAAHGHLYFEAAAVIILFVLIGRHIEARARRRTGDALRSLLGLQPRTARVRRADGEHEVSVDALRPGDLLVVRPGERLPADGVVTDGTSAVDESMLTGEPVPADKVSGDAIYAGTVNTTGLLIVRADRTGRRTRLAQIARLVREAQASKPALARLADRISAVFVPVVLALALLTAAAWLLLGGESRVQMAVTAVVSVLIIACPCALGLATPAAIAVGMGRAARNGILFRSAAALERAGRISVLAFDKTGTLTSGEPNVVAAHTAQGATEDDLRTLAGAALASSEHPLARAVAEWAQSPQRASSLKAAAGLGVEAVVEDARIIAGSRAWLASCGIPDAELAALEAAAADPAGTFVFAAREGNLLGVFVLRDTLRAEAHATVAELNRLGCETLMLSGDRREAAEAIARELGIASVRAPLSPEEKEAAVAALSAEPGRTVGMVGDGINDAPALARAHVGIALASGTDIAAQSADVTLMSGGIASLPAVIGTGRATTRIVHQNLFWAFAYNVAAIPLAAGVLYPWTGHLLNPMIASIAMALSSISVVLNSLRLNRTRLG